MSDDIKSTDQEQFSRNKGAYSDLELLGVSVKWLQTGFLEEVRVAGLDSATSRIYEIENLQKPNEPGVIRRKGLSIRCPMDGKMGASYVHSLLHEQQEQIVSDVVGPATFMLSYTWGYTICEIVETLLGYCKTHQLSPESTYVWICCLCVNQHRVVGSTHSNDDDDDGHDADVPDFVTEFHTRVTGIGTLVSMMAPWQDPLNLHRVWCVFELYTAHENDCHVEIVMSPTQREALVEELFGMESNESRSLDPFFEALAKTRVELAEASVESDRVMILQMVQDGPGYVMLNQSVNALLRDWSRGVIDEVVEKRSVELENVMTSTSSISQEDDDERSSQLIKYAQFCTSVGDALCIISDHEHALKIIHRGVTSLEEEVNGQRDAEEDEIFLRKAKATIADAYNSMGVVHKELSQGEQAMDFLRKAMHIRHGLESKGSTGQSSSSSSSRSVRVANIHANMGNVLSDMRDFDAAEKEFEIAYQIYREGEVMPQSITLLNSMALLSQRRGDKAKALKSYQECLTMRISYSGEIHPDTAMVYSNLGNVMNHMRDAKGALEAHEKALSIKGLVLGKDHESTATTHYNIATVLNGQRKYDKALEHYQQSLEVFEKALGPGNKHCAEAHEGIGRVLRQQGKFMEAMTAFQKALTICQAINDRNGSAACYSLIGIILRKKGEYTKALAMHQAALEIRRIVLGEDHRLTGESRFNIELVKQNMTMASKVTALLEKGDSLFSASNTSLALERFEEGRDMCLTIDPETRNHMYGHPLEATCRVGMGKCLVEMGRLEEALTAIDRALEIFDTFSERDNLSWTEPYGLKIRVSCQRGDFDSAIEGYDRILGAYKKILGEDDQRLRSTIEKSTLVQQMIQQSRDLEFFHNKAQQLRDSGDFDNSIELHNYALGMVEKSLVGTQSKDGMMCHVRMASTLATQGDLQQAAFHYLQAQQIGEAVFGEKDVDTQRARRLYYATMREIGTRVSSGNMRDSSEQEHNTSVPTSP